MEPTHARNLHHLPSFGGCTSGTSVRP